MKKLDQMIKEGAATFLLSTHKLRVYHFPQVPCKPFIQEVDNEYEAALLVATLAKQHLWLEKNNIIPDFSNAIGVEMWDEEMDEDEDGSKWTDYYNEFEELDFEEIVDNFIEEHII